MNYKNFFPIFKNNPELVYLDSAASTQKPQPVIDRLRYFYEHDYANIHRGLYPLSERSTQQYEEARQTVADFLGRAREEVIFTKNTTESLNLVALSWGLENISRGDEILISEMEHHSNLLPWQVLAKKTQSTLRYIPVDKLSGQLALKNFDQLVSRRTKILSLSFVSNVLGTINPLNDLIRRFRRISQQGIVVGDLAQSIAHCVEIPDCDFLAFSGHKMYAPDGIGVLAGRKDLITTLSPVIVGGGIIDSVSQYTATLQTSPYKFEAGTPNIAGAIALAEATKFIQKIGLPKIVQYEKKLTQYALDRLSAIPGLTIYGPRKLRERIGVIAISVNGLHPHDIAQVLADNNIAIRAGHHCAMPLHTALGVSSTCRVSIGVYNDENDIDRLIQGIKKAKILVNNRRTENKI